MGLKRFWRVLLPVLLAVALAACNPSSSEDDANDNARGCQLDDGVCRVTSEQGEWTLRLTGDEPGSGFLQLEIQPPESFRGASLMTFWEGREMYMGRLPIPLTRAEDGTWTGSLSLPACSLDPDMTWSLSLKSEGRAIEFDRPVWLRAPSHKST